MWQEGAVVVERSRARGRSAVRILARRKHFCNEKVKDQRTEISNTPISFCTWGETFHKTMVQTKWLAFLHQIGDEGGLIKSVPLLSLKGEGDQLAWVDFKREKRKQVWRTYSVTNTITCDRNVKWKLNKKKEHLDRMQHKKRLRDKMTSAKKMFVILEHKTKQRSSISTRR